jgi:hypothetical protein
MWVLKFFLSKRNRSFFLLFIAIFLYTEARSQLTKKQASEIKEQISSGMIKLLFDKNSNSRSTKIFLIKLQIEEGSILETMQVSDNLDTAFKESFLETVSIAALSKKIKTLAIKPQTLLIPVHYIYSTTTISNSLDMAMQFILFNKTEVVGACYWLSPIVVNRE